MRPSTNADIAKALRLQAAYAADSETKWLMEEAARRIDDTAPSAQDQIVAAPLQAPADDSAAEVIEEKGPAAAPVKQARPAKPDNRPDKLPRRAKETSQ